MFGWGKKKIIDVTFFDEEADKPFARSNVPIEQLPKSFEAHTTLHLGADDWQVVIAIPMTSEEFAVTGRLHLTLRRQRIGQVDPRKLLFSLPTISNELAPMEEGTTKLGRNVLEMHEDDWRQIEFLSRRRQPEIEATLAAIRTIYSDHRVESGAFKEIHVRKGLAEPIDEHTVDFASVNGLFNGDAAPYDGLSFAGVAGTVLGGFAWRIAEGLDLYGRRRGTTVTELGLFLHGSPDGATTFMKSISRLADTHTLWLVDWCRALKVPEGETAFVDYLK
jgi:hypothetical protein